jgi:hypothetical protein
MIALALAAMSCMPLPTCLDNGNVSPCATPTPTLRWDHNTTGGLAGYRLRARQGGEAFVVVADLLCEWSDRDEDGIDETRFCRGGEFDIPVQRYCEVCVPGQEYEFVVTAFNGLWQESVVPSNPVTECMPPLCVPPGPCN